METSAPSATCKNGHARDDSYFSAGRRRCRGCTREATRRAYQKRKAKGLPWTKKPPANGVQALPGNLRRRSVDDRLAIADILARSASLIRLRGWCVAALTDDSGRVCLMGAVQQASTTLFTPSSGPRKGVGRAIKTDLRFAAYDVVNQALRRPEGRIQDWNDEQTDKERVADLLLSLARGIDPLIPEAGPLVCYHGQHRCECLDGDPCRGRRYDEPDRCYAAQHREKCRVGQALAEAARKEREGASR